MEIKGIQSKGKLSITVSFQFSSAHRYYNNSWSLRKNKMIFGECYSNYPHGHNYRLDVCVENVCDEKTGMIINFNELEKIVQEEVINKLDHKYLNEQVRYFRRKMPTTENIAIYIWKRLERRLFPLKLQRVRVYEGDDLYAECRK